MRNPKAGLPGSCLSVTIWWCGCWWQHPGFHEYSVKQPRLTRFRSVVVITFASHAEGPWTETGRKQVALPYPHHPTAEICICIGKGERHGVRQQAQQQAAEVF